MLASISPAPLRGAVTLKPDAFARVAVGEFELWWFIEIDLGTFGQPGDPALADPRPTEPTGPRGLTG